MHPVFSISFLRWRPKYLPVEEEGCVLHKVVCYLVMYSITDMNMAWLHNSLWQIHFWKWLNLSLSSSSLTFIAEKNRSTLAEIYFPYRKKHLIQEKMLACMHIVFMLQHSKCHWPSSWGGEQPEYVGRGKVCMFQKDGGYSSTQI